MLFMLQEYNNLKKTKMNKKTLMMALCMVGHSGYAVDQKTEVQYIDGSLDQRQRLFDDALDHKNYAPIRDPKRLLGGDAFTLRDPADPLKDVTKMSPKLRIDLYDPLEEKTKKLKVDMEKMEENLESELERGKQEVLSQLQKREIKNDWQSRRDNPEVSENSSVDEIVTAAWEDVANYKSKLKKLETHKQSLNDRKESLEERKSKGWANNWVVEQENWVAELEGELDNLKTDVIRVVLNGEIAENASVDEVFKMARNRVDDYDRMVTDFSKNVRDKQNAGNSDEGWDLLRKTKTQLTNMQKGLRKLEELRPAALLATAMAGDPTGLDLVKAIRDAKNQGVQDIERIVDGHYKGSILKPEVRSWAYWSEEELNDEIKNAEANARKKQKQKDRKATK